MSERGLFLPGFTISRRSESSDSQGGWTHNPTPLAGTVRGRLSPLSLTEQERAAQAVGVVTHRFSTAAETDIKKGDQVARNGITVEVKAISVTSSGTRKQCLCEEVNTHGG